MFAIHSKSFPVLRTAPSREMNLNIMVPVSPLASVTSVNHLLNVFTMALEREIDVHRKFLFHFPLLRPMVHRLRCLPSPPFVPFLLELFPKDSLEQFDAF